jgi:hypothetical protein
VTIFVKAAKGAKGAISGKLGGLRRSLPSFNLAPEAVILEALKLNSETASETFDTSATSETYFFVKDHSSPCPLEGVLPIVPRYLRKIKTVETKK